MGISVRIRELRASPAGTRGTSPCAVALRGRAVGRGFRELLARCRIHEFVHQSQPGHRVFGVERQPFIARRNFRARKFIGERGATNEQRQLDSGIAQVTGGGHHLLRAFHEQAGKTDGVGRMFVASANQFLGRNFDSEIHDLVAVVRENDLDKILADVVDVALNRGENNASARGRSRFLHEVLEMTHGFLHGFGGLQNFSDDQLVVVEETPDFGSSRPSAGH